MPAAYECVPVPIPPTLAAVARRQSGVVSHEQAIRSGMTDGALAHAVASGRWQRLHRGVYATHSGPIVTPAAQWAAILYAGRGAALSHATAAMVLGWPTGMPQPHVSVPRDRYVARQRGLVIHRCVLSADDVVRRDGMPVTTPLRTTIDLLRHASSADEALSLVAAAVQRRHVDARRLAERLAGTSVRWRGTVAGALADMIDGSHSALELAFAALLRRHGLPVGARQKAFGRMRVDMAYDGWVIELDGRLGHSDADGTWRDMRRDNVHAFGDRKVLRFGWVDVQGRPCEVAAMVARALQLARPTCAQCR
jgi:hypothetical protein